MIQIYHNARCEKSRCGLAILEDSGKEFEIVKYLENAPTRKELTAIIKKLKIKPIGLVRTDEPVWKEKFKGLELTDQEIIAAMATYPVLIQRPIVINGDKAVLGRPPEDIKTII